MGKRGTKGAAKGVAKRGASVAVGGLVVKNGKNAVKLTIGGQTVYVVRETKAAAADVLRKIRSAGTGLSATVSPQSGGNLKVGLTGSNSSLSFIGVT